MRCFLKLCCSLQCYHLLEVLVNLLDLKYIKLWTKHSSRQHDYFEERFKGIWSWIIKELNSFYFWWQYMLEIYLETVYVQFEKFQVYKFWKCLLSYNNIWSELHMACGLYKKYSRVVYDTLYAKFCDPRHSVIKLLTAILSHNGGY